MIISEAGIWCLGVLAVVAAILGILFRKAASAVYATHCPTCKHKYWHAKTRQGLRCKKCGNIFMSRDVEGL